LKGISAKGSNCSDPSGSEVGQIKGQHIGRREEKAKSRPAEPQVMQSPEKRSVGGEGAYRFKDVKCKADCERSTRQQEEKKRRTLCGGTREKALGRKKEGKHLLWGPCAERSCKRLRMIHGRLS